MTNKDKKCRATCTDGSECMAWAMENGRCRHHGGKATGPKTDEGKKKVGGNAETHGLTSDPLKYKERQSETEADWIRCVRESILDRLRHTGREPDFLDRALAERIASRMHIALNAQDYIEDEGLVQTVFVEDGGYEKDIPNGLVSTLRQYDESITRDLKKIGVLNDPDSKKADAVGDLTELWASDLQD